MENLWRSGLLYSSSVKLPLYSSWFDMFLKLFHVKDAEYSFQPEHLVLRIAICLVPQTSRVSALYFKMKVSLPNSLPMSNIVSLSSGFQYFQVIHTRLFMPVMGWYWSVIIIEIDWACPHQFWAMSYLKRRQGWRLLRVDFYTWNFLSQHFV